MVGWRHPQRLKLSPCGLCRAAGFVFGLHPCLRGYPGALGDFLSKDGGPRGHGEGVHPLGAGNQLFMHPSSPHCRGPPAPRHLQGQRKDEMEKFTFGM